MASRGWDGERFDAVIIGAGVIGAAVGLELARRGLRTLNLDALPAAGYGSTSASAAVIRVYYSTRHGTPWPTRATTTGCTGPSIWACPTMAGSPASREMRVRS